MLLHVTQTQEVLLKRSEQGEGASCVSGGRTFQAEGAASVKALNWRHIWGRGRREKIRSE